MKVVDFGWILPCVWDSDAPPDICLVVSGMAPLSGHDVQRRRISTAAGSELFGGPFSRYGVVGCRYDCA